MSSTSVESSTTFRARHPSISSLSSWAPSTPATSEPDSARLTASAASSNEIVSKPRRRTTRRRSLNVLGTLPRTSIDFTALLRSHSTKSTRRQSPLLEVEEYLSDNAPLAEHDHIPPHSCVNMLEPQLETQNSAKLTRSRFYNILHPSRSRSKSKTKAPPPPPNNRSSSFDITRKEHDAPIGQQQHSSLGRQHSRPKSPISSIENDHRPTSRSTPRPFSTATNTTITPPTPQQRKNKVIPDPIAVTPLTKAQADVSPIPSPKARTKISHIFAKISGPKKTSRPTSPDPFYGPHHEAPSIALTYRAQSPTISLEMKASATGPSKLHGYRSPRRLSANSVKTPTYSSLTNGAMTNLSFHDLPRSSIPSEDAGTSASAEEKIRHSSFSNIRSTASPHFDSSSSRKIPQIMHTPPSPQRPSTSPGRVHHRKNSSGSQHHPPPLKTVAEERSSMLDSSLIDSPRSIKGKEKEEAATSTRPTHSRDSQAAQSHSMANYKSSVKERRHGSFNFERPTWSSSSLNGRRYDSSSQTASQGAGANDYLALRHHSSAHAHIPPPPPPPPDYSATVSASSSQQSHSQTHSHSTHHTNQTSSSGQRNSSWGRMIGQKIRARKGNKAVGTTHGQFDFEPAVPSPRSAAFHRQDAEEVAERLKTAQKQRDREREKERERQRERERERERALLQQARQAVEASLEQPSAPSSHRPVGFRSGNKGKSLDLGLGLSWAPTKVRQDALLPSFSRSLSGSSSSRNDYRNSRGREGGSVDEHGMLIGGGGHDYSNSKVGHAVADVFKQALTGTDYALFRKYVHRFDAHEIPFDGPTGIVSRVEMLLEHAPALSDGGKRDLLNSFVRIVLQNA